MRPLPNPFCKTSVEYAEITLSIVQPPRRRIDIVEKLSEAIVLGKHVGLFLEAVVIQPHLLVHFLLLVTASITIFVVFGIGIVVFEIELTL